MPDSKTIAERILGKVEWLSPVEGLCRCPGEAMHKKRDGKRDCRVMLDGAPTIYCFHQSCGAAVASMNLKLRKEMAREQMPLLRIGGQERAASVEAAGPKEPGGGRGSKAARERAAERRSEILEKYAWPVMEIKEGSPVALAEMEPGEQFRAWLRIWPPHCVVWIGDIYSSGKPEHAGHFRTIGEWDKAGPGVGNFTCGSSFRPGSYRRANDSIGDHRFLVVESDVLAKDEVGAVFAWMVERLRFKLHCIIDTGGKSLHGWFRRPRPDIERKLEGALEGLGCDPKVFNYSQPVRVPGVLREGKPQELVWLRRAE